jgi:hypothetical protein
MIWLGDLAAGATVRFLWGSNGQSGASITRATAGGIKIYKDASTTERASAAGITDTVDFDGRTGIHLCAIDLSDNTDAGFYAAGHDYAVMVAGAVIDGQTVNAVLAHFSIANRPVQGVADKTGYALSAAGVQAIWDALTSALATVGSIGKLLVTDIDAAISSRLAGGSYTAPDNSSIAAIKAKTDNLPASPAAVGSAMALTSSERNSVADALLDRTDGIETGRTPRQGWRLMLAALAGKLSGAGTTSIAIRDTNDTKNRIAATVDSNGNRSAVTLDPS